MKRQKALLAFTLCLVTSFAAADSPTDAPLLPDNANAIVVQKTKNDAKKHKAREKKEKCDHPNTVQSKPKPDPAVHPS